MDIEEMLQRLGERETSCRAEHDWLLAEAERIEALLAACRGELERLVTGLQDLWRQSP